MVPPSSSSTVWLVMGLSKSKRAFARRILQNKKQEMCFDWRFLLEIAT